MRGRVTQTLALVVRHGYHLTADHHHGADRNFAGSARLLSGLQGEAHVCLNRRQVGRGIEFSFCGTEERHRQAGYCSAKSARMSYVVQR